MINALRQWVYHSRKFLWSQGPRYSELRPIAPKLNVLLVDDDEADAYITRQVLEGNPHVREVLHAEDGVKARELVLRGWFEPHLAIVDLKMPRMDGFALLEEFANVCGARFPSVILTSSKAGHNVIRAMRSGATNFIPKSSSPRQLAEDLDSVIEDLVSARGGHRAAKPRGKTVRNFQQPVVASADAVR